MNKKTSDTSSLPKFTEGFESGHPGLAWSGFEGFLFKVTIEGKLDPDWVAKQLKEDGKAEKSKSAKSSPEKKPSDKKSKSSTP